MAKGARHELRSKGKGVQKTYGKGRDRTRADKPKLIENPELEEQVLRNQLREAGLYAANVLGGAFAMETVSFGEETLGLCGEAFASSHDLSTSSRSALSDQLYGSPSMHLAIRQEVCDYLSSHPDRFRLFVDEDSVPGGFEGHVRSMRQPGTYGTNIELSAFVARYRRPVKIWQPNLIYVMPVEEGSADSTSSNPEGSSGKEKVYHSWEHYSSLRNLTGPHTGPPRLRVDRVGSARPEERRTASKEPDAEAEEPVDEDEPMEDEPPSQPPSPPAQAPPVASSIRDRSMSPFPPSQGGKTGYAVTEESPLHDEFHQGEEGETDSSDAHRDKVRSRSSAGKEKLRPPPRTRRGPSAKEKKELARQRRMERRRAKGIGASGGVAGGGSSDRVLRSAGPASDAGLAKVRELYI
ncbi:hypothetical protein RTG_02626 [Rhodotorula toruloides ATCC 204091]|uniref:OTU domain-containing protein n=1 Tax=Rhodotorula toruloides TaxID=5286 RepID=A0A2S9ZZC1_RHOTO|nr:hypothetical protein RTG_02626 [Rhodotorula toruloides ATCC 204091]PRQ71105.1 hypothetical protein AAT19DRAFT_10645 [Rhodotorula toruloides]